MDCHSSSVGAVGPLQVILCKGNQGEEGLNYIINVFIYYMLYSINIYINDQDVWGLPYALEKAAYIFFFKRGYIWVSDIRKFWKSGFMGIFWLLGLGKSCLSFLFNLWLLHQHLLCLSILKILCTSTFSSPSPFPNILMFEFSAEQHGMPWCHLLHLVISLQIFLIYPFQRKELFWTLRSLIWGDKGSPFSSIPFITSVINSQWIRPQGILPNHWRLKEVDEILILMKKKKSKLFFL